MLFLAHHFFKFFFNLLGWKTVGSPVPTDKCIVIGGFHTSNWDFFFAMASQYIAYRPVKWLGKHTLFYGPMGSFMRMLGGVPVNRSQQHGLVKTLVEEFGRHDRFVLAIYPEGTRKYSALWKKGFYQIAMAANVPMQCMGFDYGNKEIVFGELFYACNDIEKDFVYLRQFFGKITPKNPANAEKNFRPEP